MMVQGAVLGERLVVVVLLIGGHIWAKAGEATRVRRERGEDGEAFYKLCEEDDPHPFLWVSVKGINTRNGINCG